jgi:hypothetical protein
MKLTIKDSKGNNQGDFEVDFPLTEGGKGTKLCTMRDGTWPPNAVARPTKTMGGLQD